MKIYSGKSYITADGRSTGILKLNPYVSLTYPYHSESLKMEYKEDGTPCDNYKGLQIVEPEYTTTMIADNPDSDIVSEVARLKEENEAMRVCIRQNVKTFIEMQKIFKSVEHKLPKELIEYLNQ